MQMTEFSPEASGSAQRQYFGLNGKAGTGWKPILQGRQID